MLGGCGLPGFPHNDKAAIERQLQAAVQADGFDSTTFQIETAQPTAKIYGNLIIGQCEFSNASAFFTTAPNGIDPELSSPPRGWLSREIGDEPDQKSISDLSGYEYTTPSTDVVLRFETASEFIAATGTDC